MLAGDRNAGRMDLGEARVREKGAPLVSAIRGGDIATARVRGKKKHISIAAAGEHDRVPGKAANRAAS